jgi:hypothetical protein
MRLGIALLLGGSFADLAASIQAVEFGKRTNGAVHAIFLGNDSRQEDAFGSRFAAKYATPCGNELLGLTTWLGSVEGVPVQSHVLENADDGALIEFLCVHRVFCLIAGARDQAALKDKKAWVERLRGQLAREISWYLPSLWSIIMEPWDDATLAQVIAQLDHPSGHDMSRPTMQPRESGRRACGRQRSQLKNFPKFVPNF